MLGRRPLVDAALDNMPDALGVHLDKAFFAQLLDCQGRYGRQETAVADLLDGFANAQNQCCVGKRQHHVSIKLVILCELGRPHSSRCAREFGCNNLGHFQAMFEHAESAPRSASTDRVNLRRVFARQVCDLAIDLGVH